MTDDEVVERLRQYATAIAVELERRRALGMPLLADAEEKRVALGLVTTLQRLGWLNW